MLGDHIYSPFTNPTRLRYPLQLQRNHSPTRVYYVPHPFSVVPSVLHELLLSATRRRSHSFSDRPVCIPNPTPPLVQFSHMPRYIVPYFSPRPSILPTVSRTSFALMTSHSAVIALTPLRSGLANVPPAVSNLLFSSNIVRRKC